MKRKRNAYDFALLLLNKNKAILVLGRFNANHILVDQCVELVAMPVCQVQRFLRREKIEHTHVTFVTTQVKPITCNDYASVRVQFSPQKSLSELGYRHHSDNSCVAETN